MSERRYLEVTEVIEKDIIKWKCSKCGYVYSHVIDIEPDNRCPNDGTYLKKGIVLQGAHKQYRPQKRIRLR